MIAGTKAGEGDDDDDDDDDDIDEDDDEEENRNEIRIRYREDERGEKKQTNKREDGRNRIGSQRRKNSKATYTSTAVAGLRCPQRVYGIWDSVQGQPAGLDNCLQHPLQ
jgi:hypothetical protein